MNKFIINSKTVEFDGDTSMPLLWFLRDKQKLIGTKFGYGIGSCGTYTRMRKAIHHAAELKAKVRCEA